MADEPKKILVIQTAFLGDVVLTTPLLAALRARFPGAFIGVLITPNLRDLLDGHPGVDEVLVYDKRGADRGFGALMRLARRIGGKGYEVCLLPHRSIRSALLAFIAGIPVRVGFWQSPGFWLYTKRVSRDRSRHDSERTRSLMEPFGPVTDPPRLWLPLPPAARDWAREELNASGVGIDGFIVGICPGSVWATKRWTPEGFAAVIERLIRQFKAKVLILGAKNDRPVVSAILDACREKPVDLIGRTTPMQLAGLLSFCRLVITNDNGAMHVAAAQAIPMIALFGSTTLDLGYGPLNPRAVVLEKPLPCRPCGPHGHQRCPLDHFKCMRDILPEEVMESARTLLESTPAPR